MLNNPHTVFDKYVLLKYLTFVPIDIYVDNCTHTGQCKTMITWFKIYTFSFTHICNYICLHISQVSLHIYIYIFYTHVYGYM